MSLRAVLPKKSIAGPSSLEFGFCPIKETAKQQFIIKNNGGLDFEYEWKVEQPFSISPNKGKLKMDATASFTVSFLPKVQFAG